MTIAIIGAGGFIGRLLVQRLLARPGATERLVLIDTRCAAVAAGNARVAHVEGSIADKSLLDRAFAEPVDTVYHLASVPGGASEANFDLGMQVNLLAMIELLNTLRRQAKPPVVVFASTIAVFGPLPAQVDDDTLPAPTLSYGAQKLMSEILIADYARKGWIDGRSLRLSGVVARPPQPSGMISIFLSDIIRDLPKGKPVVCPTTPEATTWLISAERCVDNLLHAAAMPAPANNRRRVWTLPTMRVSIAQMIDAIAARHGDQVRKLVTHKPDAMIEANFGAYPPIRTPAAEQAGFVGDGDLPAMLERCWSQAG